MIEIPLHHQIGLGLVEATQASARAAVITMGKGDRKLTDSISVEPMRSVLDSIPMRGVIVIGEGERDRAAMLAIGERIGLGYRYPELNGELFPEVDLAIDHVEGTNLVAEGQDGALSTIAATRRGGILGGPDIYMKKLVVGQASKGKVDINAPVKDNLLAIAKSLDRPVSSLTIAVLKRIRHARLIEAIRSVGARIMLITDGDLSASISVALAESGVNAVIGIGGAPEGNLTAAVMSCLNGEIQAKYVTREELEVEEDRNKIPDNALERLLAAGIDHNRIYTTEDLIPTNEVVFAATGITDGKILDRVSSFKGGVRMGSLLSARHGSLVYNNLINTMAGDLRENPNLVFRFKK